MTHRALILFAHGARDPRWAAPFEAVAEKLRATRPDLPVSLAYLELMSPSLAEAADALIHAGVDRLEVLPLFLGTGGHLRRDLPLLVESLRKAHPGLDVHLHPAVGEHPALTAAMASVASEILSP
ncbi:MAG: sirohydrochlorin chelatase [Rubrivivax sp.]|jgi:sirohydrochlorin cobaltochelatase|nr:CbiX/SirB N-terminal domain-containing protein [Rubrivivax sp.]